MINLFDYYSQESWDLHYSLLVSGYKHPTFVIHDDGFLPDDVLSPYQYITGFDKVQGKPRYFNQIEVPAFWEISSNNRTGQIHDYSHLRANIIYASPTHQRFVKEVEWLDEAGKRYSLDHYNKQGYRFAQTVYGSDQKPTTTTYYDAHKRDVLVENHRTGDIIVNKDKQLLVFKDKADFIIFYLKEMGLAAERLIYNSLSTPLAVARKLAHPGKDVLFWQEVARSDVPENMKVLLEDAKSNTHIAVQDWQAFLALNQQLPQETALSYLGYLYPLHRQNQARPQALIFTNSDNIESLTELVQGLPQLTFHIAAITEISSKLLSYAKYPNVKLYPNVTSKFKDFLLANCDIYLDINHGDEILSAVRKSFEQAMLLFAFKETQHQSKYVSPQNTFEAQEVQHLIQKLSTLLSNKNQFIEAVHNQYNQLHLGNKDLYRQLIQ